MFVLRLLWVLAWSAGAFGLRGTDYEGPMYRKGGNVSVAGVFSGGSWEECSGEVERGLEEMMSAIWTVEALNAYGYLGDLRIGLSAFVVCESFKDHRNLGNMAEELSRLDEEAVNIGIITTAEMSRKLKTSGRMSDSNIFSIRHIINGDMLGDMTVQLLSNLHWTNVSVAIFDSVTDMEFFSGRASEEGISVRESVLMNCSKHSCPPFGEIVQQSSIIIVIASFANIVPLAGKFRNKRDLKLILTPTDFVFDFSLSDLPKDTIVCLPSMEDPRASSDHLNNILRRKDFFTPKPPVRGPLFLGTAATILNLLKPLRTALLEKCPDDNFESRHPCAAHVLAQINETAPPPLTPQNPQISPDDVEEALKVLKIQPDTNDEMFLCIASVINGNASEEFAIFQVYNLQSRAFQAVPIMIKEDLVGAAGAGDAGAGDAGAGDAAWERMLQRKEAEQSSEPPEGGCGSRCRKLPGNLTAAVTGGNGTGGEEPQVSWRYLTWVSVNMSVGLVGITCTIAIMLFVTIKMCRNSFTESSPWFTLSLMLSVVLTYLSSLPFHAELGEGFMCGYRKCVPPVVFALLLSLLLSRSVMLAFSEAGGQLAGHINGYLQSILTFFIVAVQLSLTVQNWTFSSKSLHHLTCPDLHDKHDIILALLYDFLLLILLACVTPFIVRSKRNHKEGLLFSISVFFITIVWSAWISFYILLLPPNDHHKDAALALGLNLTASVLLLCLFIPQMYLTSAPLSPLSPLSHRPHTHTNHLHPQHTRPLHDLPFGTYTTSHTTPPTTTDHFRPQPEISTATPESPHNN